MSFLSIIAGSVSISQAVSIAEAQTWGVFSGSVVRLQARGSQYASIDASVVRHYSVNRYLSRVGRVGLCSQPVNVDSDLGGKGSPGTRSPEPKNNSIIFAGQEDIPEAPSKE